MNKDDIQSVFERCALGHIGESFAYKLWIQGFADELEEEVLEDFLLCFDYKEDPSTFVHEFLYHFATFTVVRKSFIESIENG
ncbi:hypothetical protein PZE06_02610 [Robertmurraya sp. DFI.2.37]|jgi:hypothetical protein|uniref:hypothetical protein n=1 Tax=Robertmurraya sp. DFI.2.37 TaxID=3031819 RepID=UPI001245B5E4|nr:hypothetical protein [Robertmurraya sp. DFI.2.37]MDF1507068.1 hypothetical protein [Robertmurraya sp. DFI.2.37]